MKRDARDPLSGSVIEAAIEVHRALGPGLLESIYHAYLQHELRKRMIAFESHRRIPVYYDGVELDLRFELDLLVEGELVVELKSVDRLHPVHVSQVITYLRLTGRRRALLLNFNVPRLLEGVKRISL